MLLLNDILPITSDETWVQHIKTFHCEWFNNSEEIFVNTSGSTGKPKQITLAKKAMVTSAKNTIAHFIIPNQANALLCLPANFIAGKMMIVRSIVGKWNLFVTKPTSAINFKGLPFDFVAMTPHQVIATIKAYGVKSFSSISTLIIGGGEIPKNELQTVINLPCKVFATYGMTETITHIATKAIQTPKQAYNTLPGVIINIDKRNCLTIDTNYLKEPIITNDVVEIISETSFEWLGRHDNIINSGGLKLHPEQLEQSLSNHWASPFFFYGTPHNTLGQQLVLVVPNTTDVKALIKVVKRALPKLQQPKEIWLVNAFTTTETGKINREVSVKSICEKTLF